MLLLTLSAAELASLPSAIDARVQRIMLERAGTPVGERGALTAALDEAVALRRRLANMPAARACLVVGLDKPLSGVDGVERAAFDLVGLPLPQALDDALAAQRSAYLVAAARGYAADQAGLKLADAARHLLEALDETGSEHTARAERLALQGQVDFMTACHVGEYSHAAMTNAAKHLAGIIPAVTTEESE